MLLVRDTFTAKAGQASKLAKLFKQVFGKNKSFRVMTDLVGDFNTVILEQEVESLAEYEEVLKMYRSGKPMPDMDPKAFEIMSGYTEMYITGRRDILKVVD